MSARLQCEMTLCETSGTASVSVAVTWLSRSGSHSRKRSVFTVYTVSDILYIRRAVPTRAAERSSPHVLLRGNSICTVA
jgi:hypothetical protein